MEKSNEEFENISRSIRDELSRFERQRCTDMRSAIIAYLQSLLNHQQQVYKSCLIYSFIKSQSDTVQKVTIQFEETSAKIILIDIVV